MPIVIPTQVSGVTVISDTVIRLDLVTPQYPSLGWAVVGRYTITPSGGAAAVTVASASWIGYPSTATPQPYIELTTSPHTPGGSYLVAWNLLLGVDPGSEPYVADWAAPTVVSATMTGPLTIRVVFSEAMANNAALVDAANYELSEPVAVATVTRINSTTVDVVLAERIQAVAADITVSNVSDVAGTVIVPAPTSFDVPYLSLSALSVGPHRASLLVQFNLPPTEGVSEPADWSIEPLAPGGSLGVTGVTTGDGTTYELAVSPRLTVGTLYRVTALHAANEAGPIG